MTHQDVDKIITAFMAKAPKEYYMNSVQITHQNTKYGGIMLFDNKYGDSNKIASLMIKGISADLMSVELWLGYNSFDVIDMPDLIVELIEKHIPQFIASPHLINFS